METQFLLRLLLHMILWLQCGHLVWNKFHFSAVAIWISVAYIWQWNVRPFWSTVSVPESISQTKHASNYAPQMLTDLEWYHLSDVLFFSFRSLLLSLFTAIPDALLFFVPFTLPFRSVPFSLFFALSWTVSKKPFKRDQPKALGQYSYTITMASSNSLCTCFIINNLRCCDCILPCIVILPVLSLFFFSVGPHLKWCKCRYSVVSVCTVHTYTYSTH